MVVKASILLKAGNHGAATIAKAPWGQIFDTLGPRRPLHEVGVLGLGTGVLAAYGIAGEKMSFFEPDPAVAKIAEDPNGFTYLARSRAKSEVIVNDARRSLAADSRQFDLLVLDLASFEAVPFHLVTREAFADYRRRLVKHGLLVVHASNNYLSLEPILGRLADDGGMAAVIITDNVVSENGSQPVFDLGGFGETHRGLATAD